MEEFTELYAAVYKDLYRLAYYYMGNAAEAEDAVSEAVMKAYEHFGQLRKKEAFRSWIVKILVNTCRRHMRGRYRKKEEPEDNSAVYEEDFMGHIQVERWMSALSVEERLIVSMVVFGGYRGEEIAAILHKKHSTVRSKYRRALSKLRREVEMDETEKPEEGKER